MATQLDMGISAALWQLPQVAQRASNSKFRGTTLTLCSVLEQPDVKERKVTWVPFTSVTMNGPTEVTPRWVRG